MRVPLLCCLVFVGISSSPCWATVPGKAGAPAPSAPAPPAPSVTTRITQVGLTCPTDSEAARRQYNGALDMQQRGELRAAEKAYLKAVELDPQFCDAMDNLGQMLRREGDVKQAVSWYLRSLKVKPDNAVAHQNLANAYTVQGDVDKALAEYQWLIANDPKNPEGYYGLGKTLQDSGRAKEAVDALLRACELYRQSAEPLLTDAYYELGLAYFSQEEYQKAKEYLELSYPGREDDPNANYLLGICCLAIPNQDRGQAAHYLEKAQQLGMKVPAQVLRILSK